ncbi:cobalt/nickel transport protein, partial [Roseospirillum parvum]
MRRLLLAALAAPVLMAGPAEAHFQLVYTPEVNLEQPGDVPLGLYFWHPMENGHAMDMGQPEALACHFKGEAID